MNVKQLRLLLERLPDDMEIILQKDAEGNGFSPLSGGRCMYDGIRMGRIQKTKTMFGVISN